MGRGQDLNYTNLGGRRATCLEKYGANSPLKSPDILEKMIKTNLDRYGVKFYLEKTDIPRHTQESKEKAHQTKKKNGSYGKSKSEDKRYEYLCESLGENIIERQKTINSWSIDFYNKETGEYEEFRGDYFHGRNHAYEELISMAEVHEAKTGKNTSQYRTIAGTKLRDIKKEEWFKENGLVLNIIWESDFLP